LGARGLRDSGGAKRTMGMPTDIGIIDTMIGFPHENMAETYAFVTQQTKDRESKETHPDPGQPAL